MRMIGVIGDYDSHNETHVATSRALDSLPGKTPFVWIGTNDLDPDDTRAFRGLDGLFVAPGSPYRNMEGALAAIRFARERNVPLVGT
jgi:CTP synthase (UTP-ammonia lyase)